MQVRKANNITFHISNDTFNEYRPRYINDYDFINFHLRILANGLLNSVRRNIFVEHGEKTSLQGIVMLHAHGLFNSNLWSFLDDKVQTPIQDWVDQQDGSYRVIGLISCRPLNAEVSAKKSLIIHPKGEIGRSDVVTGVAQIKTYVPGKGYF